MKVKSESEVAQLCLTLSDPMDCILPGSSIHGFSRQEYWSGVPLPSPKIIEYIGTNLTKEVKDVYGENYETLMKEAKNKCTLCVHGSYELNTVKMAILPKASTDSMQSSSKY